MARDSVEAKARRLLVGGCVVITAVNDRAVVGYVRGDQGVNYLVTADSERWTCSCPALGRCSHALAVARVALRPLPLDGVGPTGIGAES